MSWQVVQGQWWSHTFESLTGQDVGSCILWWYERLCNGSLRGDVCGDRDGSTSRRLRVVVSATTIAFATTTAFTTATAITAATAIATVIATATASMVASVVLCVLMAPPGGGHLYSVTV
jgi:hypothetical protein